MGQWIFYVALASYVIFLAIQIVAGTGDGLFAGLHRRRRQRRYDKSFHAVDPVQEALDEHVAVMTPDASLAVAIVTREGSRQWFTGHLDGELSRVPDADTLYEIGSVTKTFTASLLMAMEREGLVRLDMPVNDLLPENERLGRQDPVPITLENLATHCSGLPRVAWAGLTLLGLYTRPRQPYCFASRAWLGRWLHKRHVRYGQRYRYSNLGYGVLGNVLAQRAGMTYADALERFVLRPPGLAHTGVSNNLDNAHKVAQPHTALGRRVPPWNMRAMTPAGGLHSSLRDMTRWLEANLAIRPPLDARLHEARANSAGLHRSVALGWHVDGDGDARVVWHNGGTGGSRSLIAFAPARGTGVVVLSNSAVSVDALGMRLLREVNRRDGDEAGLPKYLQHADNLAA